MEWSLKVAPVNRIDFASALSAPIETEGHLVQTIRVLDMSGRVVLADGQRWSGVHAMDVSALPPAVYVLEWSDAEGVPGRATFVMGR